jgi:hypothetical protein
MDASEGMNCEMGAILNDRQTDATQDDPMVEL